MRRDSKETWRKASGDVLDKGAWSWKRQPNMFPNSHPDLVVVTIHCIISRVRSSASVKRSFKAPCQGNQERQKKIWEYNIRQ